MGTPTRFFNGLSTQVKGTPTGDYPLPDPLSTASLSGKAVVTYASDFIGMTDIAGLTVSGASSTFALADGLGGVGLLTPGGATTATSVYSTKAAFQFVSGNKFWYVVRMKVSAIGTGITGWAGMIKTGAATTDSLLFKFAATGVVSLVSAVDNTATTLLATVTTLVSDTYAELSYYYDGTDVHVFVNGAKVYTVYAPTIGATATNLTDELLTPILQITPAASETISADYVLAAQEVTR